MGLWKARTLFGRAKGYQTTGGKMGKRDNLMERKRAAVNRREQGARERKHNVITAQRDQSNKEVGVGGGGRGDETKKT